MRNLAEMGLLKNRSAFICRPTPEEALKWGDSLDKLLAHKCKCNFNYFSTFMSFCLFTSTCFKPFFSPYDLVQCDYRETDCNALGEYIHTVHACSGGCEDRKYACADIWITHTHKDARTHTLPQSTASMQQVSLIPTDTIYTERWGKTLKQATCWLRICCYFRFFPQLHIPNPFF